MKCPMCRQKLTSITTVTRIMSSPEAKTNDKQVRRGMKNYRACYFCNKIFNLKAASIEIPVDYSCACAPTNYDCECTKCTPTAKCLLHHKLL